MHTVTVRFTTRWPYHIGSWCVARFSGSRQFSHVMLIFRGMAYEATMAHGCRVVPEAEAMQGVVAYQDMTVAVDNICDLINFGFDQAGKPYDFAGAFGIPFLMSEDWNDDRSWWCSELVAMMLWQAECRPFDLNVMGRITPAHLYLLNFPKSQFIRVNQPPRVTT